MKFNDEQFTALAFIFERENGNSLDEFELDTISESNLGEFSTKELEKIICVGLNQKIYEEDKLRICAYWALSKRFNPELLKHFVNWLQLEVENENSIAIYQLMIAIDKLDNKIFDKKRTSRYSDENEMNIRDAKIYLNGKNANR